MLTHPTLDQLRALRLDGMADAFVEPPRRTVIDVLDGGLAVPQPSGAQSDLKPPGVAVADFAIEQQCQPFGVREIAGLFLRFELGKGGGHAVEPERSQLVESGMRKHC